MKLTSFARSSALRLGFVLALALGIGAAACDEGPQKLSPEAEAKAVSDVANALFNMDARKVEKGRYFREIESIKRRHPHLGANDVKEFVARARKACFKVNAPEPSAFTVLEVIRRAEPLRFEPDKQPSTALSVWVLGGCRGTKTSGATPALPKFQ